MEKDVINQNVRNGRSTFIYMIKCAFIYLELKPTTKLQIRKQLKQHALDDSSFPITHRDTQILQKVKTEVNGVLK